PVEDARPHRLSPLLGAGAQEGTPWPMIACGPTGDVMRVCVLQPSYQGSQVDYQHYDPPRDLGPLLPGLEVDHLFLHKLTTFHQLREARRRRYDVYVNLCEGSLDWDVPSLDVIYALEHLNLPYTGPTPDLYNPPKPLKKLVATSAGVRTPAFALAEDAA